VFFTNFERWHDKLLRLTAADLSKAWALLVRALKSGDRANTSASWNANEPWPPAAPIRSCTGETAITFARWRALSSVRCSDQAIKSNWR
jgi:hypothetical protein